MSTSDYEQFIDDDLVDDTDLSLEAILAEYKAEAYIAGDLRTPKNELEIHSRQIVMEAMQSQIDEMKASRSGAHEAGAGKDGDIQAASPETGTSRAKSPSRANPEFVTAKFEKPIREAQAEPRTDLPDSSDMQEEEEMPDESLWDDYSDQDDLFEGGDISEAPRDRGILSGIIGKMRRFAADRAGGPDEDEEYTDGASEKSGAGLQSDRVNFITYDSAEQLLNSEDTDEDASGEMDELSTEEIDDTRETDYASQDLPEPAYEEEEEAPGEKRVSRTGDFLRPLITLIAAVVALRHERAKISATKKSEAEADTPPDMPVDKAAKLYGSQQKSLKLRGNIALIFSVLLLYISSGYSGKLPIPQGLTANLRTTSLLCIILELAVIIIGLDIFTNGVISLARLKPGAESLVAVSCIASILDAVFIVATGNTEMGLPFCAVSALSMTTAIFGSGYTCSAYRSGFRACAISKTHSVLTAESGLLENTTIIMKSKGDIEGFVSRSEEADLSESIYSVVAPYLLIASLVLTLASTVLRQRAFSFFHVFAALSAASAPFSALLAFSMPFSVVARRLMNSGSAIAGYSGASELGRTARIAVTDSDLFPPGTISIDGIRILEGMLTDKVISYTGSLICAAGTGLAPVFSELMRRNGCAMHTVSDFSYHEGGGLQATIGHEIVSVGSSGFMHLLGIRMPHKLNTKNAVFTAISGSLVGVFNIEYVPITSVQDALVSMKNNKSDPYFAVRDFNITPLLIKQKFRLPTEDFVFSTFSERYDVSASAPRDVYAPASVVSRDGLYPMAEACLLTKKLLKNTRINVFISVLGAFVGLIVMFLLCSSGAFESASVGNTATFMLLWLLPLIVMSLDLRR